MIALALAGCGGDAETEREAPSRVETGETATTATTGTPDRLVIEERDVIGPGNEGADVRDVQRALAFLGYDPGPVDGVFGPATRKAVIAFQKDQELADDGLVGRKTAAAMNEELERKRAADEP